MPTYYAVAGAIELEPIKYKLAGLSFEIERFCTVSYDLLRHNLYQDFKYRCGEYANNVNKIYLFSDETQARHFTNSLPNQGSIKSFEKHYPVFKITTDETYELSVHVTSKPEEKYPTSLSYREVIGDELTNLRKNLTLVDIELPEYEKKAASFDVNHIDETEKKIYFPKTLSEEYERPFFDKSWFLWLTLTFWTVITPIIYSVYRLLKSSDTKAAISDDNRKQLVDDRYGYKDHIKNKNAFDLPSTNTQSMNPALIPSSPPFPTPSSQPEITSGTSTQTPSKNTDELTF